MSGNTELPPYSESPPIIVGSASASIAANRIAGSVQMCSIRDVQQDYFKVVSASSSSYHLCLTVDPTPIYRIELVLNSTKVSDIQIFPASDFTLPAVAAARLSIDRKSKNEPIATICTSGDPYEPNASWQPFRLAHTLSAASNYLTTIPIVTVPGTAPTPQKFAWRTSLSAPFFELWWDGPLPLAPSISYREDDRDSTYVFARVARRGPKIPANLIEMRRGGGLVFELRVILETLVILEHMKRPFL